MNDDTKAVKRPDEELDLSGFGNLTPVYSNRFHVFTGPIISRIFFGEIMKTDGEVLFHTALAIPTVDLIQLKELLDQLIQKTPIQVESAAPDG